VKRRLHPKADAFDLAVARFMHRWGHFLHRALLGAFFVWIGALKVLGHTSATSIIAETVYVGSPARVAPMLGVWEAVIGLCLLWKPLIRVGLLLIAIRLPGTLLALILKSDVCWTDTWGVPTIQGQYLIKDFILFSAAMVIGGTVREERPRRVRH